MQPISLLASMLRSKLGGPVPAREVFRPGMFIVLSGVPFLLSDDQTHVGAPVMDGGDIKMNVGNVSHLSSDGVTLTRLHAAEVDDQPGFFQIDLDAEGKLTESRFFRRIDLVLPQSTEEWYQWVNEFYGRAPDAPVGTAQYDEQVRIARILPMIGNPQFELRDGTSFARHWMPGDAVVEPVVFYESEEGPRGVVLARRTWQSMLYSRPLDLPEPAPQAEYLLVSLVEEGDAAAIQLHAGIDIPTGSIMSA
jgi:hypothetical protein